MRIERRFTREGQSAYAEIEFRKATSEIKNPDGSIVFRLADIDVPAALAVQADGSILATGYASMRYSGATSKDFAVVRLTASGQPDPRFGDGQGRSTFPVSLHADEGYAIAQTSDGDFLAAGRANNDQNSSTGAAMQAALMRLQGDPGLFRDGFENR